MIQADTPLMSAPWAAQSRTALFVMAGMAMALAWPAAASPDRFVPLDLSRQTQGMGNVAVRVGQVMARCDRATANLRGSRAAEASAAELCSEAAGRLDVTCPPAVPQS